MSGQMLGGAVGTAIGNLRETTLDEARAEFGKGLDAVVRAYNHMSETTNPEVFAFRARMITEACRVLERASYSICHAAEKAASK